MDPPASYHVRDRRIHDPGLLDRSPAASQDRTELLW
jgi:hypothetical protein